MKKIFLFLAIICSISVSAQRVYRIEGVPQRFVNALGIPINVASYYNNTSDSGIIFFDRNDTSTISFKYKGLVKKLAASRVPWDSITGKPVNFSTTYALSNDVMDSIQIRARGTGGNKQVTFWNGTNAITGSSSFIWDNSLLSLGIRNSAAPLAPIHVGNRNVNNSSDAQILISREIDNTISGNGHGFSDASNFNRSGDAAYNSYDGRIDISGSNNYDHYVAFQHGPVNNSTGTIDYISGLSTILTTNSGTVTNNYGAYILNPAGTGTVVNNYGVYVAPLRKGNFNYAYYGDVADSTDRWNIYIRGTAPNYFAGYVGIGSINTVNANLRINRNISGASAAYSVWQTGTVQSGVTSAAAGFLNQLNTAAASFTLPNYRHYHANQSNIGAGSTVQTQTGFFADETIIGGSGRNLGFFGNIPSGNGRYNSFMNGTARNFFRGNTLIGDTTLYNGAPNLSVTGKAYISDTINAGTIARIGGTSSQFLKANGSVDATSYLPNSDTSTMLNHYVRGSGSSNAIPKFNSTTRTLVNSNLSENGTVVRSVVGAEIFGNVTLGSTVDSSRSLNVTNALSAPAAYGVIHVGTVNSTVSTAYGYSNVAATQATSFTLGEYTHYFARQNTLGAGSSITNQNGFYVGSTLTGATNNYAFRGELATGTGRFNLYMNGTAANYLEGYTSIGTTTNDGVSKLLVNGVVSANFRSNSSYRLNGASGGWDRRYAFFGSSGTGRGGFGAFGNTDDLTYYYIGGTFSSNIARFNLADTSTFLYGGLTANRVRATSLVLNKDSVPITTTNVMGLALDSASGRVQKIVLPTSGTYTPTITSVANLSSTTAQVCYFTRVGDIVTVSGFVQTQTVSDEVVTTLDISLPIASNFTSAVQLSGNSSYFTSSFGSQQGLIKADATNDRATISWLPMNGAGEGDVLLQFTFTYRVL